MLANDDGGSGFAGVVYSGTDVVESVDDVVVVVAVVIVVGRTLPAPPRPEVT